MVTFRQVMRASAAAARRAERDRNRYAKETAKQFKEQQKQNELANAQEVVRRYDKYIDVLMSVHKSCEDKIEWEHIKEEEPPQPEKKDINESVARKDLNDFTPSFFDKIFGYKKKIATLEKAISQAKEKDHKDFELAKETHDDWLKLQNIANGIHSKNPKSYADAINYFQPFDDISALGSKIEFSFDKDSAEINIHVNNSEVIPDYVVSVTKSGKLSKKDMPSTKFYQLYQDYVCGVLLRVAREIHAHLPLQMITINALTKMVNTSTGHLEDTPILSALIPPDTIDSLNFDTLDQSDSMRNFIHNMKFSKTNGFTKVDKLTVDLKVK